MPHQCVRCGTMFEDGNEAILKGCSNCGAKAFFFIRKEKLDKLKETPVEKLSDKEKQELEKEVYDVIGQSPDSAEPVVLDFESIRVQKSGKYEVDLVSLFRKKPIIFKLSEGKYMIDLATTFEDSKSRKS